MNLSLLNSNNRVLVCGDRNWVDYDRISSVIHTYHPACVIEGGAKGADSCAREAAMEHHIPYEEYRARWEEYGKSAGPIRNQQMITEGKPDLVLAFHDNLQDSKGTKDMVRRAKKAGIPIIHFYHTPEGWGSSYIS